MTGQVNNIISICSLNALPKYFHEANAEKHEVSQVLVSRTILVHHFAVAHPS